MIDVTASRERRDAVAAGRAAREHETVLGAVLAHAAAAPDSIALVCGGRSVSYGSLARRVERWAQTLHRRGVGPESIVGIALPRSEDLPVAMLATLRAGAAYLPIDRAFPAGRCVEILRDSGAALLVADAELPGSDVAIASPADLDSFAGPPALVRMPAGAQLAYVMYTSGSTGGPKGVAVEHRSLLNHMTWMLGRFGAAADRVVQRTSCAFDASVWEFFLPLMAGGTLVLGGRDDYRDPSVLRDVLRQEAPAAIQCVPTFLRLALDEGVLDGTSLRYLFVGGEVLATTLAERAARASGAAIVNLYGPTETTIDATYFEVDAARAAGDAQPIGRPIANVRAAPVDRRYEFVSDDTIAELWIGGAGVARGYHRRPALTAAAFVPDPFDAHPGRRAYRSGDLVRRHDGVLSFVRRSDRLVKLHGFRIELEEIEAVLRQHAGVADAVVMLTGGVLTGGVLTGGVLTGGVLTGGVVTGGVLTGGGPAAGGPADVLAAYCLARDAAHRDTDAVRRHVGERLPHYMVPAQIVWLDRFPLKANGKLDTSALPPPAPAARIEAPASAVERALVEIWTTLFKRPVGVTDNFFDLGGDSIRTLQMISLAKARGLTLTLEDTFAGPTIRALAPRVGSLEAPRDQTSAFDLVTPADARLLDRGLVEDAYPTTALVDALYLLSETSPRYEVYVTSCELGAEWNGEAFGTALRRVVGRHPWLRTAFAYEGFSCPLQVVHRDVPAGWLFEDLRDLTPIQQDQYLHEWIEREKRQRPDWGHAPVWRIGIHLRDRHRFQLTLSEPVFDGWSVSSFLAELLEAYAAAHQRTALPLRPPPRSRYRDFVAAEQAVLRDTGAVEFWRRALSRNAGRNVPRPIGERCERRGVLRIETRFPERLSNRLREMGRAASVPLKSVLLGAHARVVATLTGRAAIVSGVIVNGRSEAREADQVLGLHINTAPLVFDLTAARSWLDLARQALAVETEALPYRRYPLAAIQKMHGRLPLFETAFNFTDFHRLGDAVQATGIPVLRYLAWDQTFFPLTAQFHVDVTDRTIGLGLDYDSSELATAQVEAIADLYRTALERMAADPTGSIRPALQEPAAAPIAPARATDGLTGESVLETVWRIARAQPDAIALEQDDQQISYGTLARTASALADRLRRMGVAGRSVLACFDSQYEAVVSLLALVEAGAIYVPVDPSAPYARLEHVARSAAASLCLCRPAVHRTFLDMGLATLDVDLRAIETATPIAPRRPVAATAAYRMYTSGSTGVPKGVEVGHAALSHFVTAMRAAVGLSKRDIVAGLATIAFDISLMEMLLPLTTGARLVTTGSDVRRDGERLGPWLTDSAATVCQATPTTWRMLLEADATLPPGMRVISGGEALPPDLAARLLGSVAQIANVYGPTETAIWSAIARIRSGDAITLGAPLGATTLRLVDAFRNDCWPGAAGEIGIGGPGAAHGYVGNPALTAERFVPDEHGDGCRMYLTGDVGRRTPDGSIEFLGRLDDQVKVRGYRIELGDIEVALRACRGIRDAAVIAAGDESPTLVGYVTIARDATWDEAEARRELRRLLPEPMIPRRLVALDALPLTTNQKIDRSRLPAPEASTRGAKRVVELFEHVKAMTSDEVARLLASRT